MDGFDVEALLAVPALWILLLAGLGMVIGARGHDLRKLTWRQLGKAAVGRPLVDVLDNRGRRVGIDDGYRLPAAIPGRRPQTVSALDLLRRVTARRVGQCAGPVRVGKAGRQLLGPVRRARW